MQTHNTRSNSFGTAAAIGLFLLMLVLTAALSSCGSSGGGSITGPAGPTGSITIMSQRDTDRDGVIDLSDPDDDNDGLPDVSDDDDDNDGTNDEDEMDSDDDGVINDHDDDYVEITGLVSSVGDESFVLYGYTVMVDNKTKYESDDGLPFGFDDITVDMRLEAEGVMVNDTTMMADEVERDDNDDDSDDDDSDDGTS